MMDDKVFCVNKAKGYGKDYWDGERRFGYGGYRYDGRWKSVAEALIKAYDLKENASILDVGCGKAYLLYELKQLLPKAEVAGFDISEYAIEDAKTEVGDHLFVHKAEAPYPYDENSFDLTISINTLHNLELFGLKRALQEMERVGKNKFLCVESYRSEQELFNLQCWALTCESFFSPKAWIWLFAEFGYSGDYEFIFFE
jgi:ubiquinone/menaquinone biosynthesis C-methylase UbiE